MTAPFTTPYNTNIDAAEQIKAVEAKVTLDGQGDQYSIALARKPAWHQKGYVKLGGELTVDEAIKHAHLGWYVSKSPVVANVITDDGGKQIPVENHFALTTTNAYTGEPMSLGVVGNARETVQIPEFLQWATELVGGYGPGAAQISSAGSYMQQRKVFASLVFANGIKVGGQDPVDLYFGLKEHMDGRGALQWTLSNVRGECRNTVNASIRGAKTKGSIRHTENVKARMAQVAEIVGLTDEYTTALETTYDKMLDVEVDDLMFEEMMAAAFDTRIPNEEDNGKTAVTVWNKKIDVLKGHRYGEFNTFARETGWGAFNALTSFLNYGSGPGEDTRAEQAHKQDQRAIAVMDGRTDAPEERAMAYVMANR